MSVHGPRSRVHGPLPADPPPDAGTRTTPPVRSPDAVVCERCSEEMFRMHAVWRCPRCGYKTDCCGW